jgi:hypothetical protein
MHHVCMHVIQAVGVVSIHHVLLRYVPQGVSGQQVTVAPTLLPPQRHLPRLICQIKPGAPRCRTNVHYAGGMCSFALLLSKCYFPIIKDCCFAGLPASSVRRYLNGVTMVLA